MIEKIKLAMTDQPISYLNCCKKINEIIEELNIISSEVREGIAEHLNEHNDCIEELQKTSCDQELTDSHLIERLTNLEEKIDSTISLGELGSIKEELDHLEKNQKLTEKLLNIYYKPILTNSITCEWIREEFVKLEEKIEKRLSYLEQYNRLNQPSQTLERKDSDWPPLKSCKPDYDPDDVKFTNDYQIANEGTFEWALIHMKNGKCIRRSNWVKIHWWQNLKFKQGDINPDGIYETKFPCMPHQIESICEDDLFANDWELVVI